jgi:hypothetical protein
MSNAYEVILSKAESAKPVTPQSKGALKLWFKALNVSQTSMIALGALGTGVMTGELYANRALNPAMTMGEWTNNVMSNEVVQNAICKGLPNLTEAAMKSDFFKDMGSAMHGNLPVMSGVVMTGLLGAIAASMPIAAASDVCMKHLKGAGIAVLGKRKPATVSSNTFDR